MALDTLDAKETSLELLREFERTGRPEPFEAFMRRHASMVYATCLKVTRDPHDAEDATQATFLTLASKSRLNGEIRQPEAWLRKVAHRLSLDLIRSKKRRVNRENLRSEMTSEAAPLDSHDHANAGEVKGILNEELAKLPAAYRMPLILHYFGGLSRDEMAEQLKLKPSTLGVRLHRAREQLRRKLAARGILLPSVALTALLTEVVHQSVCGHMMQSTAQQASAIALGHAAAPQMFAASTGVDSIGSLLSMLAHGKLKVILSALVVMSAISMTSAQVRLLIPKAIRSAMPLLHWPSISLPKMPLNAPLPRIAAATPAEGTSESHVVAAVASAPMPARLTLMRSLVTSTQAAKAVAVTADNAAPARTVPAMLASPADEVATSNTGSKVKLISARNDFVAASPAKSSAAALKDSSATVAVRPAVASASSAPKFASARADDAWSGVIPEGSLASSSGGGGGGGGEVAPPANLFRDLPGPSSIPKNAPARVTSPVTGSVPALRDATGSRAGEHKPMPPVSTSGDQASASSVGGGGSSPAPKPLRTSRTVLFSGVSANYGGYSDDSWKPTTFNKVDSFDHSSTLGHTVAGEAMSPTSSTAPGYSFNYPAIPGATLSVNGARATLVNGAGIDNKSPATIQFVDTASTLIPTLPTGHKFIGVWQLDTDVDYSSVDLLVRYDDLRASRLGLNERILKLWVSDGHGWSLLWRDPSFGRDINQNLMWVTAGSDVKFFAASAPEPVTLASFAGALTVLTIRRRA